MAFNWNDQEAGVLIIDTPLSIVKFDRGLVFYIKDKASNEVLLDSSYSAFTANLSTFRHALGVSSWPDPYTSNGQYERGCSNSYVPTHTEIETDVQYRLIFSPCVDFGGNPITNTSLQYDFYIDSVTGEVTITLIGIDSTGKYPYEIYLPVANFGKTGSSSLVMAQEVAFSAGDAAYSYVSQPPMVVGKGTNACFGVWSENTECLATQIQFGHIQNTRDQFICTNPFDPKLYYGSSPDITTIYGGPWRFTTQANWVEVARRWRSRYLIWANNDGNYLNYLWNNPVPWLRKIHCFYGQSVEDSYYNTLPLPTAQGGSGCDADKTLMALGSLTHNGDDPWILFGQISPTMTNKNPTDSAITYMLANGYKPTFYTLLAGVQTEDVDVSDGVGIYDSDHGWLNRAIGRGGIPGTWTYDLPPPTGPGLSIPDFNPDYSGTKSWSAWKTYWSNVPTIFYSSLCHMVHPGHDNFKNTMTQMYKNMASTYGYGGLFIDTMSGDRDSNFHALGTGNQIVNGEDFQTGTRSLLRDLQQSELAAFYEYFDINLMPYCPIGFEGYWWLDQYWFILDNNSPTGAPKNYPELHYVNHPLRTALLGSFTWTRESINMAQLPVPYNTVPFNFKWCALMGTLPEFALSGNEAAPPNWTTFRDRARLFCKFDLFNDLPSNAWSDSSVLAYYRSNTGNMFRFEDRGSDVYAYVEEHPNGDYDRLLIDSGTVTLNNIDEILSGITASRYHYISLPADDADLDTPYTIDDVEDVSADDTNMVAQAATSQIAIHQFKQQMNGAGGIITAVAQVTIPCSTSTAYLQIYNRSGTPAWDTIDSDNATGANTDFTLSATVADLTDYKDENNIVACRVYQEMQ